MPIPLLLTLGLHMAGALFWLVSSLALGFGRNPAASRPLFRVQMGAATVAVFSGGGLWQMLHAGGFGPGEAVLAVGAVLAIAAAGVQGAMVGGPARRLSPGDGPDSPLGRKVLTGQKVAAGLLAVAFVCMVAERYV